MPDRYDEIRKCFQNWQQKNRQRALNEHERDLAIVERMEADERAFRASWNDWS